jgi:DeoR/GlpR family transcriptional regulator of sugar metabolism
LRANVLICSASAVTGTTAFIQDPNVVRVKRAMMAASAKRVLLLDHSKFGRTALHVFDDLTPFVAVLVTDGIETATAKALEQAGVKLGIVKVPA